MGAAAVAARDAVRGLAAFGTLALAFLAVQVTAAGWGKAEDWLAYELAGGAVAALALLGPVDRRLRGYGGLVLGAVGLGALAYFCWWRAREVAVVALRVPAGGLFHSRFLPAVLRDHGAVALARSAIRMLQGHEVDGEFVEYHNRTIRPRFGRLTRQ